MPHDLTEHLSLRERLNDPVLLRIRADNARREAQANLADAQKASDMAAVLLQVETKLTLEQRAIEQIAFDASCAADKVLTLAKAAIARLEAG